MSATPRQKADKLVDWILAGQVVPFLGAGVSFDAKSSRPNWNQGHQTERMVLKLKNGLRRDLSLPRAAVTEGQLAVSCELFLNKHTQRQLVRRLRLFFFQHLRPTPAHRFLAFIAREYLIREVITTNYDCCFEHAYKESHGRGYETGECKTSDNDPDSVRCSCSAQRYGATRTSSAGGRRNPPPLLAKINGCSRIACKTPDALVLTERGLQSWRTRRWAEDMFRDRLRCSHVVFSGFGSPEPQVRHTVGLVLEEFSPEVPANSPIDNLLDSPNCPMVVYYDKEREPSFEQWQIAAAFKETAKLKLENKITPEDLLFGPTDADIVFPRNETNNPENLPADDFWRWIYAEVIRNLLRGEIDFHSSKLAQETKMLLDGDIRLLEDARKQVGIDTSIFDNPNPLRDFLVGLSKGKRTTGSSVLLSFVDLRRSGCDSEKYFPIVENGPLVWRVTMILAALKLETNLDTLIANNTRNRSPFGLRVPVVMTNDDDLEVFLAAFPVDSESSSASHTPNLSITQLVLEERAGERLNEVSRIKPSSDHKIGELPSGWLTLHRVSWSSILRKHRMRIQGLGDLREVLEVTLANPSTESAEMRPSYRDHFKKGPRPSVMPESMQANDVFSEEQ